LRAGDTSGQLNSASTICNLKNCFAGACGKLNTHAADVIEACWHKYRNIQSSALCDIGHCSWVWLLWADNECDGPTTFLTAQTFDIDLKKNAANRKQAAASRLFWPKKNCENQN
jgi:hypothetical protein